MNLIPIDTGGTPTELVGGDASPGGDFAALMTGLMSGDTQIVPLIDIPTDQQLPEGAEAADGDDGAEVVASILEFVGTPPSGLTISSPRTEAPPGDTAVTDESIEFDGEELRPVAAEYTDAKGDTATGSDDGPALATVHPISNHLNAATTQAAVQVDGNEVGPTSSAESTTESTAPTGIAGIRSERLASPAGGDTLRSTPRVMADALGPSTQHLSRGPIEPPASESEASTADTPLIQPDVELEAAATTRQVESVRPGGAISQPAMVGIARRVEEAIAALATKPDPKIVTLQLDELDGLRLTVALRPDGIHLSSTGDTALTTEIERALASRGFDMASTGDESKQRSGEGADDGWRPESAPAGRSRRPNPTGIRL